MMGAFNKKFSGLLIGFWALVSFASAQSGQWTQSVGISVGRWDKNTLTTAAVKTFNNAQATTTQVRAVGVRLVYDVQADRSTTTNWSYQLTYRIRSTQPSLTAYSTPIILSIGSNNNVTQTYIAAQTHPNFSGTEFELIIDDIADNNSPAGIRLEADIFRENLLAFNPSTPFNFNINTTNGVRKPKLVWEYLEGAYEYELEWTWIDAMDSEFAQNYNNSLTGEEFLVFPFEHKEPIRITTTDQNYDIDLLYPKGRVFYRIRAIGHYIGNQGRYPGDWLYGYTNGNLLILNTDLTAINEFESDKTWQSVTTYAEEGKYKKVISYHDGSLRNRQTVTNLSSDNTVLVAESKYDYEGRAVVNILPVPIKTTALSYKEDLNLFTSNPRAKINYDNGTVKNTTLATSSQGAAQYYSPANNTGGTHRNYIPDAEGYPYSLTTYMNDNTGRVRRQNGVGLAFHPTTAGSPNIESDTRNTQYYYGTASQAELNRLFGTSGNNVGSALRYRKNMVVDPNGQVSVSYLDQEGRTIATALAGTKPNNLDNIPSYGAGLRSNIPINLMNNTYQDTQESGREIKATILNTVPNTDYNFTYALSGTQISQMNVCTSCRYKVEIRINDPDGIQIRYETKTIIPANCAMDTMGRDFTLRFAKLGNYTVYKSLVALDPDIEKLKLDIRNTTVFKQDSAAIYTEFINKAALDTADCSTCATCPTSSAAIDSAIATVSRGECESILQQIMEQVGKYDSNAPEVQNHPEFCHYKACVDNVPSAIFDKNLDKISTWSQAKIDYDSTKLNEKFYTYDPYFKGGLYGDDDDQRGSIEYRLKQVVAPSFAGGTNIATAVTDLLRTQNITGTNADTLRWQFFKSFYIAAKQDRHAEIMATGSKCNRNPAYLNTDTTIVKDPRLPKDNAGVQAWISSKTETFFKADTALQSRTWTEGLMKHCPDLTAADTAFITAKFKEHLLTHPDPKNIPFLWLIDKTQTSSARGEILALLNQRGCPAALDSISLQAKCAKQELVPSVDTVAYDVPHFNNGLDENRKLVLQTNTPIGTGDFTIEIRGIINSQGNNDFPYILRGVSTANPSVNLVEVFLNNPLIYKVPWVKNSDGSFFQIGGYYQQSMGTCGNDLLTIVRTNGNLSAYINGNEAGIFGNPIHTSDLQGSINWFIGELSDRDGYTYKDQIRGYIREFRVWNVAKTPNEIAQNSQIQFSNPTIQSGLIGYFNLERYGTNQHIVYPANALTVSGSFENRAALIACRKQQCTAYAIPTEVGFNKENEIKLCQDQIFANAKREAQLFINRNLDSLTSTYLTEYKNKCLQLREDFQYTFSTREHHYTLYYYDQAGNLVQTVAPREVDPNRAENYPTTSKYRFNSIGQPIWQSTPDAGITEFAYNRLGQLRLSQNAKQKAKWEYSYTKYDAQGRTTEVGQITYQKDMDDLLARLDEPDFPKDTEFTLAQKTQTFYDEAPQNSPILQENLRNRVTAVQVVEKDTTRGARTLYSYDVHGNVKHLVQQLPNMPNKQIRYSYDLISGKVNQVSFQADSTDDFRHRYSYDADNRLTQVHTSIDGYLWNLEARYLYYLHGPLARIELGDYQVQGLDYYYTLQGWLKGMNANNLDPTKDMGKDGFLSPTNLNQYSSKDVVGFSLHYFTGDYKAIVGSTGLAIAPNIAATQLFNGNIAAMLTNVAPTTMGLLAKLYRYDQLNRIRSADTRTTTNSGTSWVDTKNWREGFGYDANGNIIVVNRHNQSQQVDGLTYVYKRATNQLTQIRDRFAANLQNDDLDSQAVNNYVYDEIGNLIQDKSEGIDTIGWTVYGKVQRVVKTVNGQKQTVEYRYDGTGNRVMKVTSTKTTYYVRDASGNVMAIYEQPLSAGEGQGVGLIEQPIYGSSRIGMYIGRTKKLHRTLGNKIYELSNHLGNILATITDNKIYQTNGSSAKVISGTDYYAFGAAMPSRSYQDAGYSKYRYGYQGSEKNEEINGTYTTEYRQLSTESCRWWGIDPKATAYESPYVSMGNNPIWFNDVKGDTVVWSKILSNESKSAIESYITLLSKSPTFAKIWERMNNSEVSYLIETGAEFWSNGTFAGFAATSYPIKSTIITMKGNGTITFDKNALAARDNQEINNALILAVTEEFAHAIQFDVYRDKLRSSIGHLNIEFEAKTATGLVLGELNLDFSGSSKDLIPINYGQKINRLNPNTGPPQIISGNEYNGVFNTWLDFIDKNGGYGGQSSSDGSKAVTPDFSPQYLWSLLKR
jgi:YD repeat-containing protein